MYPLNGGRRMQQVGFSGSRTAAPYIHTPDRTFAGQHNCGTGQPAVAVCGVVADLKSLDHPLILPTCQTSVDR
jgi:hypothetical protein